MSGYHDSHDEDTDPRFPTGVWRGVWFQDDTAGRMGLWLKCTDGYIVGDGMDPVGPFEMNGTYDPDTGQVVLVKHYHDAHTLDYRGTAQPDGHLRGRWSKSSGNAAGPWDIWPVLDDDDDYELISLAIDPTPFEA